jgi:transposase
MMGEQKSEPQLFNYAVNLEKRVRANHPLRQVKAIIDFSFVREEVARCYGRNGNESVPPEVILKMMFLLFFDDITSERELMEVIGERLDYFWFLDYGLDDKIPDHSVLSKARARWGKEVFENLRLREALNDWFRVRMRETARAVAKHTLARRKANREKRSKRPTKSMLYQAALSTERALWTVKLAQRPKSFWYPYPTLRNL